MARPRIFISSTYYDMHVLRADVERFVKEVGFEPVLFERGHVAYGSDQALEDYCYREISSCDILVAIIGGKYGSRSKDHKHSISQRELKIAIELGRQVYVFVERSVHSEYRTYQENKDVKGFKASAVDDIRVYSFLEEVYALPVGNPIEPFELSEDIVRFLREQWAGLFQRLLQESGRQKEINIIENLKNTAATLNRLVTFLTKDRTKGDEAIKEILLSTHPAFNAIKTAAKIQYRVVFYTRQELNDLLSARGFKGDESTSPDGAFDWDNQSLKYGIRVSRSIFGKDDRLKVITPEQWKDDWVTTYKFGEDEDEVEEDDIPF
jgi:hypothetical protein